MTETRQRWWLWPLLVVLLPLVVVAGVLWLLMAVLLQLVVWLTWCPRGRYALVVYSNSPIWRVFRAERLYHDGGKLPDAELDRLHSRNRRRSYPVLD